MKFRTPLWLKLGASFLAVALTTIYVGQQGISASNTLTNNSDHIAQAATSIADLGEAKNSYTAMRMNLFGMIVAATSPSVSAQLRSEYAKNQKDFDAKVDENLALWKASSPLAATDGPKLDAAIAAHRAVVYGAAIPLATGNPTTLALPAGQSSWTLSSTLQESSVRYGHLVTTFDEVRSDETNSYHAEVAKAQASSKKAKSTLKTAEIAGVLIALFAGVLLSFSLLRRIAKLQSLATALLGGDLTKRANVSGRDELGDMGRALDQSLEALSEDMRVISSNSVLVADSSAKLTESGNLITLTAANVSDNVQMVAAASEEMDASIREIAINASSAASRAGEVVVTAGEANEAFADAVSNVKDISRVVNLIATIAEQTNLLALNATIEAARAGESGKGFAVVAGEVKELAQQTARALEDITRQIQAVDAGMSHAQSSVTSLTSAIAEISESQTTIAGAVEEQSATTSEIARSVGDAAVSASQIASSINEISDGKGGGAAGALASMSDDLRNVTQRFKTTSSKPTGAGSYRITSDINRFGGSASATENADSRRSDTNWREETSVHQ